MSTNFSRADANRNVPDRPVSIVQASSPFVPIRQVVPKHNSPAQPISPAPGPSPFAYERKSFGATPSFSTARDVAGALLAGAQRRGTEARTSAPLKSSDDQSPAPAIVALILLGPVDKRLRDAIDGAAAWLDESSGGSFHWIRLANPRLSEDRFRALLKRIRIGQSTLYREWSALVADRGSAESVEQHETKLAADCLGITLRDLPCIVLLTDRELTDASGIFLDPRSWASDLALRDLLNVLRTEFTDENVTAAFADGAERAQGTQQLAAAATARIAQLISRHHHSDPISTTTNAPAGCAHGDDFTWVTWHGQRFQFKKGQQAEAVRRLWEEAERASYQPDCGLSEATVAAHIGSADGEFSMRKLFADHAALESFIRRTTKGVWALRFEREP